MNAVVPVTYQTADGVERVLRSTRGAKALIRERFGSVDVIDLLNKHSEEALFEIAWFMMHDEMGEPPKDLPLKKFMNITPASSESLAEVLAAITAAMSQGKQTKNELEAPMLEGLKRMEELQREELRQKLMTLPSGPSPISASESETAGSTSGDSSNANYSLLLTDTTNETASKTQEPAQSPQPSSTPEGKKPTTKSGRGATSSSTTASA
jgi:hypothetical protein